MYVHGSSKPLDKGLILTGRGDVYEQNWADTDFYHILERHRPSHMIAHKDGVFMCNSVEDVGLAGGSEEYIAILEPVGTIERHDMNWYSQISCLVSDGYGIDSFEIIEAARNYWNGVPHFDESVWEIISSEAKVIDCLCFDDFIETYPNMVDAIPEPVNTLGM